MILTYWVTATLSGIFITINVKLFYHLQQVNFTTVLQSTSSLTNVLEERLFNLSSSLPRHVRGESKSIFKIWWSLSWKIRTISVVILFNTHSTFVLFYIVKRFSDVFIVESLYCLSKLSTYFVFVVNTLTLTIPSNLCSFWWNRHCLYFLFLCQMKRIS